MPDRRPFAGRAYHCVPPASGAQSRGCRRLLCDMHAQCPSPPGGELVGLRRFRLKKAFRAEVTPAVAFCVSDCLSELLNIFEPGEVRGFWAGEGLRVDAEDFTDCMAISPICDTCPVCGRVKGQCRQGDALDGRHRVQVGECPLRVGVGLALVLP